MAKSLRKSSIFLNTPQYLPSTGLLQFSEPEEKKFARLSPEILDEYPFLRKIPSSVFFRQTNSSTSKIYCLLYSCLQIMDSARTISILDILSNILELHEESSLHLGNVKSMYDFIVSSDDLVTSVIRERKLA